MSNRCAICLKSIEGDDAPILAIGAYGAKRCLCESCAELVDTATESMDYDAIAEAMDGISKKMGECDIDDPLTVRTMGELMSATAERAKAIKDGTYEPSEEEEAPEDVPEELRETDEDRALDEHDAAVSKRLDRIMNWVTVGVLLAVIIFGIWWFFLK